MEKINESTEIVTFDLAERRVYGQKIEAQEVTATKERIKSALQIGSKAQIAIAFDLLLLVEKANKEMLGGRNIYDYAKQEIGLARGPVSEHIKVAKAFRARAIDDNGNKSEYVRDENAYFLDSDALECNYSALLEIAKKAENEPSNWAYEKAKEFAGMTALAIKDKLAESSEPEPEETRESSEPEQSEEVAQELAESADIVADSEANESVDIFEIKAEDLTDTVRTKFLSYFEKRNPEHSEHFEVRITF